jgi:hypothetical protein
MKVRAKRRGYYGNVRETGQEFSINDDQAFSDAWMEKVEDVKPEPVAKAKPFSKKKKVKDEE